MTDKPASIFLKLSKSQEIRTDTEKLRDIFDDVETALAKKVPQLKIVEELKKMGFTKMGISSFRSAVARIRKERGLGRPSSRKSVGVVPPANDTPAIDAGGEAGGEAGGTPESEGTSATHDVLNQPASHYPPRKK